MNGWKNVSLSLIHLPHFLSLSFSFRLWFSLIKSLLLICRTMRFGSLTSILNEERNEREKRRREVVLTRHEMWWSDSWIIRERQKKERQEKEEGGRNEMDEYTFQNPFLPSLSKLLPHLFSSFDDHLFWWWCEMDGMRMDSNGHTFREKERERERQ